MPIEIFMPRMGLTMEEGTVVAWLKGENQPVKAGEPLLEIETDKSTVEIESPATGVVSRILVKPGETVPVGEVIGYLATAGEAISVAPGPNGGSSRPAAPVPALPTATLPIEAGSPSAVSSERNDKVKASPAARHLARRFAIDLSRVSGTGPGGRVVAWNVQDFAARPASPAAVEPVPGSILRTPPLNVSPVALKVAEELGVDLHTIQGAGPGGRITRADVERAARQPLPPSPLPMAEGGQSIPPSSLPRAEGSQSIPPSLSGEGRGEVLPLTRPQKIMAERMSASFRSAPHFYLHVEVDARKLVALRSALLEKTEQRYGVRLTYTDFLVKYTALALQRHPRLLQQWSEDGLIQAKNVDVGIAMDTQGGLVVPVVRDAARLGLAEIARRRVELSEKAQAGRLLPQDLELGVFTLTNLGMYGIDSFDAILNPPQAAILAVGRIKERALVVDGQVIAAPMMNLSLSVDHRVLDGAAGARFLGDLVELLEAPELAQV